MSRAWYLVSLIPIAICVAISLLLFSHLMTDVEHMPRFVVPGDKTLQLAAGEYIAFGETDSRVDGTHYVNASFRVKCMLTAADGHGIEIGEPAATTNYSLGGYRGSSLYDFTIAITGTYTFVCSGEDNDKAVIAVGHGIGGTIVKAIALILAGLISAGVFFGLLYTRRQKYKRAVAARTAVVS